MCLSLSKMEIYRFVCCANGVGFLNQKSSSVQNAMWAILLGCPLNKLNLFPNEFSPFIGKHDFTEVSVNFENFNFTVFQIQIWFMKIRKTTNNDIG